MADKNANDYRKLSPENLHKLVGCFVHISLCEGEQLRGWVYTIDPVSLTIVIAKDDDTNADSNEFDPRTIVFVLSQAVQQLRVIDTTRKEPEWLQTFALKQRHKYTEDELQNRKAKLIEWLHKNRVPILDSDEDAVQVVGGLVIEAPYDIDSCKGTNEIVLERIRKLISSMPDG